MAAVQKLEIAHRATHVALVQSSYDDGNGDCMTNMTLCDECFSKLRGLNLVECAMRLEPDESRLCEECL